MNFHATRLRTEDRVCLGVTGSRSFQIQTWTSVQSSKLPTRRWASRPEMPTTSSGTSQEVMCHHTIDIDTLNFQRDLPMGWLAVLFDNSPPCNHGKATKPCGGERLGDRFGILLLYFIATWDLLTPPPLILQVWSPALWISSGLSNDLTYLPPSEHAYLSILVCAQFVFRLGEQALNPSYSYWISGTDLSDSSAFRGKGRTLSSSGVELCLKFNEGVDSFNSSASCGSAGLNISI